MGGSIGSTTDLNLDLQSGTDNNETTVSAPSVNVVNSDTVNAIGSNTTAIENASTEINNKIKETYLLWVLTIKLIFILLTKMYYSK